jgi:hypothetical protein
MKRQYRLKIAYSIVGSDFSLHQLSHKFLVLWRWWAMGMSVKFAGKIVKIAMGFN